MRKEYESPKAEKVEFDYKEVVVASACDSGVSYTKENHGSSCSDVPVENSDWYGPKAN